MNRYGNPVFDCNGALMRALSRCLGTVVTISGEIDMVNIEKVTEHARRYLLASTAVVLDLSGVRHMDDDGLALLRAFDEDCANTCLDWALIPSDAVVDVLARTAEAYPIAGSVSEALNYFADESQRRRTLLLPLLTKSA